VGDESLGRGKLKEGEDKRAVRCSGAFGRTVFGGLKRAMDASTQKKVGPEGRNPLGLSPPKAASASAVLIPLEAEPAWSFSCWKIDTRQRLPFLPVSGPR
jgi:hypothetical protein